MKQLLAVIDMQNDFIDGTLGTQEARAIVGGVAHRIQQCRKEGYTLVFTRDTHEENYLDTLEGKKLPVIHCIKGSKGWEISDKLDSVGAKVIDKPVFGSMELAQFAKEQKFEKIELVGLCTDICIISNAMLLKAVLPEAQIIVNARHCAGVTPDTHEQALRAMELCQIEIYG